VVTVEKVTLLLVLILCTRPLEINTEDDLACESLNESKNAARIMARRGAIVFFLEEIQALLTE